MAETLHRLPSKEEIALSSPDGLYAIRHFHGKTLEQAEAMLEDCALGYAEDLMWMEPVGFRYYVQAFVNFCLSEKATSDPDSINGLEGALGIWIEQRPKELVPCAGMLAQLSHLSVRNSDFRLWPRRNPLIFRDRVFPTPLWADPGC